MNSTTQKALEEKIERLEREISENMYNSYQNGFNDGLRVEIHVAITDNKPIILSKEEIENIQLDIKKQLNYNKK